MDGFRNSTGNASTNTRGGYYNNNNKNNRNKFNGRRNNSNNGGNGGGNGNGGNGGGNGNNGNNNRMTPNSPTKQQMNQHSPTHYSNGNTFNYNNDYNGPNYQNRNNFGNKFNNQNSPNKKYNNTNKFNNKRRGGANNYGNPNYNYQQGNNLNSYGNNGQMNRSLSKESPNNSFTDSGSNIPTSISLDNFEVRQRSPVMTSSFSFTQGSQQSPSYTMKTFVATATITENEPVVEASEEASAAQPDATSFYGSPMSQNEATLNRQGNLNTTPTGINNSTDNESTGSPTVVSKAESKTKTDDQISSLSSSSSPDSRNLNNETSESQILVTASEGEFSFGNDEPSNVENTIMNPNDSVEHESLTNLMVNTKITDIDEFIKQQSDAMSSMITKATTVPETTAVETEQVETIATGVVNYNNANNDELDGKIKTNEHHEAKKEHDDQHNMSTSSSSSSSSDGSSTTVSTTTTSSPQSSIDPSSSSSSSTSFSNQTGEKNSDATGCLDKDAINIRLDIEYDQDEKEPTPKPEQHALDREVTSEDFKGDMQSLINSDAVNYGNVDTEASTTGMYSLQSNAMSEMDTIIHQSPEDKKDEEVTCLVSKLVSDVISQAIQTAPTAPAPMAYDEIEMDDDDEPAKPEVATGTLSAFDNDHGYFRNQGYVQEEAKPDMSQRESIMNLKNIDEDDEESEKLHISMDKNVSFTRENNDDLRRSSERGHMNSPTGEVDLQKMEAMNSALPGKPVDAKPTTSKSARKSQEPAVDCFSCNII